LSGARQPGSTGRPLNVHANTQAHTNTGDGVEGRSSDRDPDAVAHQTPAGHAAGGDVSRCPFHRAMRALGFGRDVATSRESRRRRPGQ